MAPAESFDEEVPVLVDVEVGMLRVADRAAVTCSAKYTERSED